MSSKTWKAITYTAIILSLILNAWTCYNNYQTDKRIEELHKNLERQMRPTHLVIY